ncbi:MAG: transketolase family protein, partial [Candidatus Pacebacteria bacterium]|nr:transketolase family protein [Candidatus Paceibacterota bacterium]
GATHQMTEDIALMRAMPNMTVIVPCDAVEAEKAVLAAAHIVGPVYIRFAREKSPVFTTEASPFTPNKAQVVWESHGVRAVVPKAAIIACGSLVYSALQAARLLEREGIQSIVVNVHTIKPLDEKKLTDIAKKYGAIVTVEEHQVAGGLGGAVAELLARTHPVPMEFIGMHNVFGSSGAPEKLSIKYGMDTPTIIAAVKKAVGRK